MECLTPGLLVFVEEPSLDYVHPRFCGPFDSPWEPLYSIAVREGWEMIPTRCGHCIACRIQRSKEWKIRMLHELQMHPGQPGFFVTLTYADDQLPPGGSLHRPHLQKYLRRLRKKLGKFRFAACGEYGKQTGRPHYHVIFFGLKVPDLWVSTAGKKRRYRSDVLQDLWGHGLIDIGTAENDSIAYVAGYATKKLGNRRGEIPIAETVDPVSGLVLSEHEVSPEFFGTSSKPGLGGTWVDRFGESILRDEFIVLEEKGKTTKVIPRYYLKRMEDHPWMEAFKDQRASAVSGPSEHAQREFLKGAMAAQLVKKSREVL